MSENLSQNKGQITRPVLSVLHALEIFIDYWDRFADSDLEAFASQLFYCKERTPNELQLALEACTLFKELCSKDAPEINTDDVDYVIGLLSKTYAGRVQSAKSTSIRDGLERIFSHWDEHSKTIRIKGEHKLQTYFPLISKVLDLNHRSALELKELQEITSMYCHIAGKNKSCMSFIQHVIVAVDENKPLFSVHSEL